MADRGFTIKDMLQKLNIELNISSFLEGQSQLSPQAVEAGRKIASLRIYVEQDWKNEDIYNLKGSIPLSMARLTNQIIFVCGFLTNFLPALLPSFNDTIDSDSDADVENYFEGLSNCD